MFMTKRAALVAAALVLAVSGAWAQDVAEGQWINLFDGESLYGWTVFGNAEWGVQDGAIVCAKGDSGMLASTSQFGDFELAAKIRVSGNGTAGLEVRGSIEGHASETGGAAVTLPAGAADAAFTEVVIRALGNTVEASVNGEKSTLSASRPLGFIALQFQKYHRDRRGPKVEVSEVKLRPLGLKPLFNGVDLDGWNIIPDKASKFSVVDGALNIKDGNGQIETAGVYKNFMLQLDIISNGEHLNSGVFFRGPVGVFWKGYESQVRNEWQRDDRAKPVDFGTGGVYGVNPARKVVSTDHEWFAKTVVANGNHFAVWINGYQVSDFYDTRPVAADGDGKNGYVDKAGTINLQGHDPTTDLSFKNINIQEYPGN